MHLPDLNIAKDRTKKENKTYQIRQIYYYDEEQEKGILVSAPWELSYEKAKQGLSKEDYTEFCDFFERRVSFK